MDEEATSSAMSLLCLDEDMPPHVFVTEYFRRFKALPSDARQAEKVWFSVHPRGNNTYTTNGVAVNGDYIGALHTALHVDDAPVRTQEDAAGRCFGVSAWEVLKASSGNSTIVPLHDSVANELGAMMMVPYDGCFLHHLSQHSMYKQELRAVIMKMLPFLAMQATPTDLPELLGVDREGIWRLEMATLNAGDVTKDDLVNWLMDKFEICVNWNQLGDSCLIGGCKPFMLDISVGGFFDERDLGWSNRNQECYIPEHNVVLPMTSGLYTFVLQHIDEIFTHVYMEITHNGSLGLPRLQEVINVWTRYSTVPDATSKLDWPEKNAMWQQDLLRPGLKPVADAAGAAVKKEEEFAASVKSHLSILNAKKRERKKRSKAAKRDAAAAAAGRSAAIKRWQRAIHSVIKQNKHNAEQTKKNKAASEARRKVRRAADAEKARKNAEYNPAPVPHAHAVVGKWAEEQPTESDIAAAAGKKAVALNARKAALFKHRQETQRKKDEQLAIVERMAKMLEIGNSINREQVDSMWTPTLR